MRLRLEVGLGVGALLALQLGSSFAAIGLLSRTSQVTDRLLADDVESMFAIREMLAVLAGGSLDEARFDDAFRRVSDDADGDGEARVLLRIARYGDRALAGDPLAAAEAVDALVELAAITERSMAAATEETRGLGLAGTWSAALLGGATFGIAVLVFRRLRTRIEDPVLELDATLAAARAGDRYRRCPRLEGPRETRRSGENLNWVLDRLEERTREGRAPATRDRAVMLYLLDEVSEPLLIVGAEDVVAMNAAALAVWTTAAPTELLAAIRGGRPTPGWIVERLEGAGVWFCRRTGAPSEERR